MFHVKHGCGVANERIQTPDYSDRLLENVRTVLRSPPKGSSKWMLSPSESPQLERQARSSSKTVAPLGPCIRKAAPFGASTSPLTSRNPGASENPRVIVSFMGGRGSADRSPARRSITWTSVSFSSRMTCLRKFARLRRGSSRYTGLSGNMSLMGIPGNPAPLPMSRMPPSALKRGTTERESRKWRRTTSSGSRMAVRFSR